jgi:hypothetical protein
VTRTLRDLVEAERAARIAKLTSELASVRAMTAEAYLERYPVEVCPRDIPGEAWAHVRSHSPNGEHVTIQFDRGKPGLRCNANSWEWYARGFYSDDARPWLDREGRAVECARSDAVRQKHRIGVHCTRQHRYRPRPATLTGRVDFLSLCADSFAFQLRGMRRRDERALRFWGGERRSVRRRADVVTPTDWERLARWITRLARGGKRVTIPDSVRARARELRVTHFISEKNAPELRRAGGARRGDVARDALQSEER